MNSTLKLRCLQCANLSLDLLGRYGGVGGAWAVIGLQGHVRDQIVNLRARRMVDAMHLELETLPVEVHAEALVDLHLKFVRDRTPAAAERQLVDAFMVHDLQEQLRNLDLGVDFSNRGI